MLSQTELLVGKVLRLGLEHAISCTSPKSRTLRYKGDQLCFASMKYEGVVPPRETNTNLAAKKCENAIKEWPPCEDAVRLSVEEGCLFFAADNISANIEPWKILVEPCLHELLPVTRQQVFILRFHSDKPGKQRAGGRVVRITNEVMSSEDLSS